MCDIRVYSVMVAWFPFLFSGCKASFFSVSLVFAIMHLYFFLYCVCPFLLYILKKKLVLIN